MRKKPIWIVCTGLLSVVTAHAATWTGPFMQSICYNGKAAAMPLGSQEMRLKFESVKIVGYTSQDMPDPELFITASYLGDQKTTCSYQVSLIADNGNGSYVFGGSEVESRLPLDCVSGKKRLDELFLRGGFDTFGNTALFRVNDPRKAICDEDATHLYFRPLRRVSDSHLSDGPNPSDTNRRRSTPVPLRLTTS